MANPKKHHFVPESYLAGFTLSGSKNDRLWVIDQKNVKVRPSTPQNEAHQRYLYRVDVEKGGDEFGIEKGFSEFENEAIPILKEISEKKAIPIGEKYDYLISYIALQIVRTPKYRDVFVKNLSNMYSQMGKLTIQFLFQSKERFNQYVEELINRKPHLNKDDFNYEKLLKETKNIDFEADINQNYHIKHALKMSDTLLPHLGNRSWCILLPQESNQYFITSDHPVELTWSDSNHNNRPIGYGLQHTDVIFPVNKSVTILGRFESQPPKVELSFKKVAQINSIIANASTRYLYCCEEEISWFTYNEKVGNLSDLIKFLKKIY